MSGLADQINDRPMILPALKMSDIQLRRLFSAQTATQEEPEQCSVSLALQRIRVRHLPESSCLVGGEPVAKPDAEILWPLTRRMPVARSELSKPESAASYARRLTAASLPLIVPGAS